VRGFISIFHKYDLANCPACAHLINGKNAHTEEIGFCGLCGSDITKVRRCIKHGRNQYWFDVYAYNDTEEDV
jgi:hypothetical protein